MTNIALITEHVPALLLADLADLPTLAQAVAYEHKTPLWQLATTQPLMFLKDLNEACETWLYY